MARLTCVLAARTESLAMIANQKAARPFLIIMLGFAAAPLVLLGLVAFWICMPIRFESRWVFEPKSQAFKHVAICANGQIARGDDLAEESRVTVALVRNDGVKSSRTATYTLNEELFNRQLAGPETILAWMTELGIPTSAGSAQVEAREISKQILHAASGAYGRPKQLDALRLIEW